MQKLDVLVLITLKREFQRLCGDMYDLQSLGNLADVFFSGVCLGPWKIESEHWNFVDLYNQPPVQ